MPRTPAEPAAPQTTGSQGTGGASMRISRSAFLKLAGAGAMAGAVRADEAGDRGRPRLSIGVLTDCQYADADTLPALPKRLFRRSPQKLADALDHLGSMGDLDFMVHLGDAIDHAAPSFRVVMPVFRSAPVPVYHVAGNHDYSVADHLKKRVPSFLGMPAPHYPLTRSGWRFLFLHGNALSLFAHAKGTEEYAAAEAFRKGSARTLAEYSGGLGERQRTWLISELEAARAAQERAVLCCHYPLLPFDGHSLWDAEPVLEILTRFRGTAAAWFCGHNHDGGYVNHGGVHLLNFRGMVDTTENSYARVDFHQERIEVQGFGREPSRVLHPG